jgi:hypothetical protein
LCRFRVWWEIVEIVGKTGNRVYRDREIVEFRNLGYLGFVTLRGGSASDQTRG